MSNITLTGILRRIEDPMLEIWHLEVLEASANAKVLEGQTVTVKEVPPVEVGTHTHPTKDDTFFNVTPADGSFPALQDKLVHVEGALLPLEFSGVSPAIGIVILALNVNPVSGADE